MLSIQLAAQEHIDELCSFDQIAQREDHRVEFINQAVSAKSCYVAIEEQIKGYAVLEYSFFGMGFISMLYVRTDSRRQNIGVSLLNYLVQICKTDRLFTSTNLSNQPMQSLLAKAGYKLSGTIHDLDKDDPELIYVKYLRK